MFGTSFKPLQAAPLEHMSFTLSHDFTMPPALVAFIPHLLAHSGKKPVVLVGLTLANLVAPEAVHGASGLAPEAVIEFGSSPPINVRRAESPTVSTVSATTSVPELSPSPQFSANQGSAQLLAQAITPANDGTGTVVTQPDNNTFNITGGTSAGANLFHSFEQLGLDAGQVANIIADPAIANILGRVVGGDPSVINGLLQVTGGNANLFLMNPAGIIFGPEAQVIVPGAFTATTASAIQLGEYWFNALGSNEYANLVAAPRGFAFVNSQPHSEPGAIINAGTLEGQSIILLGGFVVNTGTIEVGGGNISIVAVPEERLVRITQENSLLSLDLPIADNLPSEVRDTLADNLQGLTILDIPTLLSRGNISQGLGLTLEDGIVRLAATGNSISTAPGAGVSYISGNNISLGSYNSNLPLEVEATGNIIGRSIEARSIDLSARNNISIENGIEGRRFSFDDSSPVNINANNGNVEVGFIKAGWGGIDIRAGGSFRATGSFIDTDYSSGFPNTIPINSSLVEFLVEHGHDRSQVLELFGFGAGLELSLRTSATSVPQVGSQNAPISIRFGNANEELVNEQFQINGAASYIRILGDSSQTFYLGPQYENNIRFTSSVPGRNLRPYDPNTNPTGLDLSDGFFQAGIKPNSDALRALSNGVSGTVAGIAVRGGDNSGLYGSVQSRLFSPPTPEPPTPEPPTPEPPTPEPPTPEPPTPDLASTQNLDVAVGDFCDDETIARSFDSDILGIDERLIGELPANQAPATTDPCTSRSTPSPSQPGNALEAPPSVDLERLEPVSPDQGSTEAVEESVDTSKTLLLDEPERVKPVSTGEEAATATALLDYPTEAFFNNQGVMVEVSEATTRVEPVVAAPAMNLSVETVEARPIFSNP